ncbi:MAG: AmmeMemoRadiSam system protein A [Oscillospiraceae bacterium]|jgi:AmmeMemoRadiSam system protein A|nr:AmmeMemoRadiSam system protein A [Oscillospiraceae bacterium]
MPDGGGQDPFRALARASLEHTLRGKGSLPLPEGLPRELTEHKAGVFVTLYKGGHLRGCIGTVQPTTACVGSEIMQNAVSSALHDPRFPPVTLDELPQLTIKVDVLHPPEPIDGEGALDPQRYGVIVASARKRGLLLPRLDGVDTVAEQVAIAKQKAGIAPHEPYSLSRFEVTRHE